MKLKNRMKIVLPLLYSTRDFYTEMKQVLVKYETNLGSSCNPACCNISFLSNMGTSKNFTFFVNGSVYEYLKSCKIIFFRTDILDANYINDA